MWRRSRRDSPRRQCACSFGAAGSYDAAYLLALSAVSLGAGELTGKALAQGFSRLVPPGERIQVGASRINRAVTDLSAGQNIDFDGASGPLDFDLQHGEALSDISIWCVPPRPATGTWDFTDSGQVFLASTLMLDGQIGAKCK